MISLKHILKTKRGLRNWSYTNFPSSISQFGLYCGSDGYCVSVGDVRNIVYSNIPTSTWTMNPTSTTGDLFFGVYYDGSNWVAVGSNSVSSNSIIYTTTDPTSTWTNKFTGGSVGFYSINNNGTYWIAVGYAGSIYTATDPASTWTSRTSGTSNHLYSVYYDGTYVVAVGASGTILTATDPTSTWTSRTSGTSNDLHNVYYDGTYWVAVGVSGTILTTTDPTSTWTSRTSGVSVTLYGVTGDGINWVISGNTNTILTATDPTSTWIKQSSPAVSGGFRSVSYDSTHFIINGATSSIVYASR